MSTLFPSNMLELNLDSIKAKLNYFELQLHELHWQTKSFAEHSALSTIYDKVFDLKDEIVEKIMGYTGVRTKAMPVAPIKNWEPNMSNSVVKELIKFAKDLENFGKQNNMPDIENIAQGLSGLGSQTIYRLSLT